MKKLVLAIITLCVMTTTAFAAGLEQDQAEAKAEAQVETTAAVERYAYVMDRLDGSIEEYIVVNLPDYLGIVTELKSGDLIATGDDQLNFNLINQVEQYSQKSKNRKLALKELSFDNLTVNEQKNYPGLKNFHLYKVEEQVNPNAAANGNQVIINNNTELEKAQYFVSMITQIKSLRHSF